MVDGCEAPILRANGLFRGVRLAAGPHRVVLAYRPRPAAVGAAITVFGLAAAAAGLALRALAAWRARGSVPARDCRPAPPEGSIGAGSRS
jgi:hypothetical protein